MNKKANGTQPPDSTETPQKPTEPAAGTPAPTGAKNPASYGLWVGIPALVAILLAILFRQVVPALVIGLLCSAYMLVPCLPPGDPLAGVHPLLGGFRLAFEKYVVGAVVSTDSGYGHLKIILFTLIIGFTVGAMGRSGGTQGMVELVAGRSRSPRRCGFTAWLAGMVVFFDDYANTMIIGPTMRPVFDRVKLSRAKLAYIIDSTAAPVASLALIGTWVGAEIGYINDGLKAVATGTPPAFLLDEQGRVLSGMQAFLQSIPYRFYPILALFFVLIVVLTRRDFGPMRTAERKALSRIDPDPSPADRERETEPSPRPRWWLGFIPIGVLVAVTVIILIVTGYYGAGGAQAWAADEPTWAKLADIVGAGDAYLSIFYGAILSAFTAVVLSVIARACSLGETVEGGLDGMTRMFPAIVILVLAWALSQSLQDLKLGQVAAAQLKTYQFQPLWLPLAIFVTAALISFATGTSWGTMGILCPMTVEITSRLAAGMEPSAALALFYASVGSVLAGAVFGDHCSPISDTTVLSSLASDCKHEEHVWTQIPYAVLTAVAAMGAGNVLCSVYGQPWYVGLAAGAAFLFLFLLIFGRRPTPSFELAEVVSEPPP